MLTVKATFSSRATISLRYPSTFAPAEVTVTGVLPGGFNAGILKAGGPDAGVAYLNYLAEASALTVGITRDGEAPMSIR